MNKIRREEGVFIFFFLAIVVSEENEGRLGYLILAWKMARMRYVLNDS